MRRTPIALASLCIGLAALAVQGEVAAQWLM